jgi:hypothetical protein
MRVVEFAPSKKTYLQDTKVSRSWYSARGKVALEAVSSDVVGPEKGYVQLQEVT